MSWNLNHINLKNINVIEKIDTAFLVEVPQKNIAREVGKILKNECIVYKIIDLNMVIVLEYKTQIEKVKKIVKDYKGKILEEKLIIRYEIELPSKKHLKRLVKMIYKENLLYKVTGNFFIEVFCGHRLQIEKLFKVLEDFDRLWYIVYAE
jgi:hypothetical protein